MSGESEGALVRERQSVALPGSLPATSGATNMVYSGTGEDTKRTTRAASKRAAIDDFVPTAFPAAGAHQAKKRAALADISNHASLSSSWKTPDVSMKKRAALAKLSNDPNIPTVRSSVHSAKINASGHALDGKSKPLGRAPVQFRTENPQGVPAAKRDKVFVAVKAPKDSLASDRSENRESVVPDRLAGSTRLLIETSSKVSTTPEVKASAARGDAIVIETLERKTLENLYISRNNKVGSGQEVVWSRRQTFTDIDCEHSDPQMCSIYAIDIYQHLRMQEVKRRPTTAFMEALQQDISASMRGILIDWLIEVAEEYKLVPDTLYLAVSYIDRFLSKNIVNRQRLQLLGVSCMLIAAKYEEICAPQVEEFCYITDNTYGREEVLEMERRVLTNLHFELTTPTTKSFLRRFIRAAQAAHSVPALQLEFLGNYLAELTLVEYPFLHYLPSVVAASAVFVARLTLDRDTSPWNSTLQYYTGYRAADLEDCVRKIHDLQLNSRNCTLPAIREKYSQHKYECVATLLPASKIPSEYFEALEG